jgi:tRNA A-37 threonylcarbamoyl transferase component Bud32/tetratricopeptide (TPR) repeat protein
MNCLDENVVLKFLEGRLPSARVQDIEAHLQTCEACRDLVALSAPAVMSVMAQPGDAPAPAPPPPGPDRLERGTTIRRYVVLAPVGNGAMGEVFAAFDPELNRKIALKILRARSETAEGRTRLLREAQAIAKLQHPNVVVVHDAGTIGERVFIAMEFIEGTTLRGWLSAARRSRREILDVYLAAGRGLAAAHARGLVHRDFKPDNVMVTDEEQVRVMDFGLARHLEDGAAAEPVEASDVSVVSGANLSLKLTQTGAVVGTPAYMAPEQFTLAPTDARTDQFSFCIALYEALYGKRPFEGATFGALMTSVAKGAVSEPPPNSAVPGWLRRVLLRGLATDPARRFPSMAELLAALEADPTVRRRRVAAGVLLAACAVVALVAVRRVSVSSGALCREGGERWAGIWDAGDAASPRKAAIHASFLATGKGNAELAFSGAARALDEYTRKWRRMYDDACEATHVRGEQSAEVLDLRMSCLQERLNAGSALSDVFAQADATVVDNAVQAATALPALDRCADVPLLKAVVKPPEDAASRAHVEALRKEQARLIATRDSGRCAAAERLAQALIPRVRAEGYLPLLADTLLGAGYLSDMCTDISVGIARYREAFTAALASEHKEAAATAALELAAYIGDRQARPAEGRQWLDIARALSRRFDNPLLEAWLLVTDGSLLGAEGHGDQAVEVFLKAVAVKERLLGRDHPDVLLTLTNVGNALTIAGRSGEAAKALSEAHARVVRVLGAEHPRLALIANNEGEALNALRRHDEARRAFELALRIWRKAGADKTFISYALTGLGVAYLGMGRSADALPPLEEALRIRGDAHMAHDVLGETKFALARALWADPGRRPRALALAQEARADYVALGTQPKSVGAIDAWLKAPSATL